MIKKLFTAIILSSIFITPTFAGDFTQMNPTVKINSYKKLFTENVMGYGSGSGTIINKNGLILTNHHVVFNESEQKPLDAFEICITFNVQEEPECKYTANLISSDKELDIALLKMNETDVFGKKIPDLKYLNYKNNVSPKERSIVQAIGYPGSGGKTITITKGQISGFDKHNDYNYFKTDTDFDHGSSGGTALDENGNFIGIPTYIRSYAETVGYFLDIKEALPWIEKNINKKSITNDLANKLLIGKLSTIFEANKNLIYKNQNYPELSIKLPKKWKFVEISSDQIYAEEEKATDRISFNAYFNYYQFNIEDGYLNELNYELNKLKERYPDYKKEDVILANEKGWKITYSAYNMRYYSYYIPYGYAIVSINYSIDLDEEAKQLKEIQPLIDSIEFKSPKQKNPNLEKTIQFNNPSFEISSYKNWVLQKNIGDQPIDLIIEGAQEDNYKGFFNIYYRQIPKDEQQLEQKDRLEEETKYLGGSSKLIYKDENILIDGLPGWLYVYEYEGDEYQEKHKRMTISLENGEYKFVIIYDDLSEEFNKNLETIKSILKTFKIKEGTGEYKLGDIGYIFNDIEHHRFARDISELADKKIISGYNDGGFLPEEEIKRSEALKMILVSKNNLEEKKSKENAINFKKYFKNKSDFKDVRNTDWFNKYIHYALEKKIISGYSNKTFKPNKSVELAEALKIIINVYNIPVWEGETKTWYKKYMDKGYELNFIPRGIDNAGHHLTRAELAYIINRVYKQAK